MGVYTLLMIIASTFVLSLLFYVVGKSSYDFDGKIILLSLMISFFSGVCWNVVFDVKNDTFYKPLKETLHIEYKNGVPTDTTYTYE